MEQSCCRTTSVVCSRLTISAPICFVSVFAEGFALQSISSEVRSYGFLSKNWNGYALGFQSGALSVLSEHDAGRGNRYRAHPHARIFLGGTSFQPLKSCLRLRRGDGRPLPARDRIRDGPGGRPSRRQSLPFSAHTLPWLDVSSRSSEGAKPITRSACKAEARWPWARRSTIRSTGMFCPRRWRSGHPRSSKIFDRKLFGYVMKHTIEPQVVYRYQTGIDNFSQIIRFDQRDILADTNEVEYGVVNRLFAKKTTSSRECFQHPKYDLLSDRKRNGGQENHGIGRPIPATTSRARRAKSSPGKLAQKYFLNTDFRRGAGARSAQCVRQHRGFHRHRVSHRAAPLFAHHLASPDAGCEERHPMGAGL